MLTSARNFYKKNERWIPIAFFVLGFCFDALVLRRIDEPITILQQAAYILVCTFLISIELVEHIREFHPPKFIAKIWLYREALLHFLMGTLLNAYTIFYFKSASAITSFVYIGLLVALLILNEFKKFGRFQTQVHIGILSLCLISYLVLLMPLLFGFIGGIPFLVGNLVALLLLFGYRRLMTSRLTENAALVRSHIFIPFAIVQATFIVLYMLHILPPVPLSVSFMGIYHDVKKTENEYQLTYFRSDTKFWQHGDQTFLARQGDTIYCFVRIFAPTRFKDQLQVRWLYKDPRLGWQSADAIPLSIVGGREEGFRGVTKKNNYQPGDWRVQIETTDEREIGRIGFTVERDDSTEPRDIKIVVQ
jgi:hypothetical protein